MPRLSICSLPDSSITFELKILSISDNRYDIFVKHNASDTISNITTSGVNIKDGKILINVTGEVPKGCKNTYVNQVNRIINFTSNVCSIYPNLLVDEMDTSASHSAYISNFSDDDMFYLKSRGINEKDAKKLLIKGLFMDNVDESLYSYIDKILNKYWR